MISTRTTDDIKYALKRAILTRGQLDWVPVQCLEAEYLGGGRNYDEMRAIIVTAINELVGSGMVTVGYPIGVPPGAGGWVQVSLSNLNGMLQNTPEGDEWAIEAWSEDGSITAQHDFPDGNGKAFRK